MAFIKTGKSKIKGVLAKDKDEMIEVIASKDGKRTKKVLKDAKSDQK